MAWISIVPVDLILSDGRAALLRLVGCLNSRKQRSNPALSPASWRCQAVGNLASRRVDIIESSTVA